MVTFAKLNDGSWGLRGPQKELVTGRLVTVSLRDGTVQTAIVGRVLAQFQDGNALATKDTGTRSGRRDSGRRYGGCRECGGPVVDAPHHRAMGGYCGECAFDEYDM